MPLLPPSAAHPTAFNLGFFVYHMSESGGRHKPSDAHESHQGKNAASGERNAV